MKNYTTIPDAGDILAIDRIAVLDALPRFVDPYPIPTVTEVVRTYAFEDYQWRTFETASGIPVSYSMSVTHPKDPTSRFIVMLDAVTGEWTVQCPSKRSHHGPVMIDAVQRFQDVDCHSKLA